MGKYPIEYCHSTYWDTKGLLEEKSKQIARKTGTTKRTYKIRNFPSTMEQNSRNNATHIQRHQPRAQKEETSTKTRNGHTRCSGIKKTCQNCRLKKHNPDNIINLSTYILNTAEKKNLLSKGLNFIPTQHKKHIAKLIQDFLLFDRKLRLKYCFPQGWRRN